LPYSFSFSDEHFSRKIFKNILDKENYHAIIELKLNDNSILRDKKCNF